MDTASPTLGPLVAPGPALSSAAQARYARHLMLPGVGDEGQRRLAVARVLLIGAGGLGSPAALYLAAAGVGTLGIVDGDVVSASNLQRQVIHSTPRVGQPKTDSARAALRELNPDVEVVTIDENVTAGNALDLLDGWDLVIDGSDNFPTRYLMNDAAVLSGIPLVYGSVFRFEGQVAVFFPPHGPCYRCLFPDPPPAGLIPNCAQAGVFGAMAGHIGTAQAMEALKLICGVGTSLVGALHLHDALDASWTKVTVQRNPDCAVCGDTPTVTELIDYEAFCGTAASDLASERTLDVASVRALADAVILDVREADERAVAHIPQSLHIPLGELDSRLGELADARTIVAHCASGVRSQQAARTLLDAGLDAYSMDGGIDAWLATT